MLLFQNLVDFFTGYGYWAVFAVLLLCGFGVPVPEDITLVAGGVISSLACDAEGPFWKTFSLCHQVHIMFFVSMAGVLIGDSIVFFMGRIYGERLFKVRFFSRLVTPARYEMVQQKFARYGGWVIFAGRFMPGLRAPIFAVSGMTRQVSYLKFLLIDGMAALISVPIWVYLGFWGELQLRDLAALEHYVKRGQAGVYILIGTVVIGGLATWLIKRAIRKIRGRIKT